MGDEPDHVSKKQPDRTGPSIRAFVSGAQSAFFTLGIEAPPRGPARLDDLRRLTPRERAPTRATAPTFEAPRKGAKSISSSRPLRSLRRSRTRRTSSGAAAHGRGGQRHGRRREHARIATANAPSARCGCSPIGDSFRAARRLSRTCVPYRFTRSISPREHDTRRRPGKQRMQTSDASFRRVMKILEPVLRLRRGIDSELTARARTRC
jgi:hypothetical protein